MATDEGFFVCAVTHPYVEDDEIHIMYLTASQSLSAIEKDKAIFFDSESAINFVRQCSLFIHKDSRDRWHVATPIECVNS
jgi:hypothetical protein